MGDFNEIKIPLKNLKLWSENPRFPNSYKGKNEEELIDYIVSVPHYQIKAFGKEVVEDFDMPIYEKFAIYNGEGDNIAFEGNRRLTVYKLLVRPELTSNVEIRDYFLQLKRSIDINENLKIDCVVCEDKTQTLRYVNRKHLKNNNEVGWGSLEKSNAKLRWLDNPDKVDIFKSNMSQIINSLLISEDDKKQILGRGFVTTLFRIVNSSASAKIFKLQFDDDNNLIAGDDYFYQKLAKIINDILLKKEFNKKKFSRLNTADIEEYINSITIVEVIKNKIQDNILGSKKKEDIKQTVNINQEDKSIENISFNNKKINITTDSNFKSGAVIPSPKIKENAKSTNRKYLIPKDCKLDIEQEKINNIYRELKDDLILDDSLKSVPNAVGVLFRVFLEVSIDHYAKSNGHNFSKEEKMKNKIYWVVEKMKSKGIDKKSLENIASLGTSTKFQTYLSIEKFHEYVHSSTVQPTSGELKAKWSHLQSFFELLWQDMKKG